MDDSVDTVAFGVGALSNAGSTHLCWISALQDALAELAEFFIIPNGFSIVIP